LATAATILLNFKESVENDPNGVLESWTLGSNPCGNPTWQGVTCSQQGHVTGLKLAGMGLKGQLPPNLGLLKSLLDLDLSRNDFEGKNVQRMRSRFPFLFRSCSPIHCTCTCTLRKEHSLDLDAEEDLV
jgi:hypothetical protein